MSMDQISLFAIADERAAMDRTLEMYREWQALPSEKRIASGSQQRRAARADLSHGYCRRWMSMQHVCPDMPPDTYAWLNYCQPPEYWVLHKRSEVAGDHIDVCPYCGANLAGGDGDVTMIKADERYWRPFLQAIGKETT